MRIETYDYITGGTIDESSSGINFGEIVQGQHSYNPLILRVIPTTEIADTSNVNADATLVMFLQNDGGWPDAQIGYFMSRDFTTGIQSGSAHFSNYFTPSETSDPTIDSSWGVRIPFTDSTSDYVWVDLALSPTQVGSAEPNFRFFFTGF